MVLDSPTPWLGPLCAPPEPPPRAIVTSPPSSLCLVHSQSNTVAVLFWSTCPVCPSVRVHSALLTPMVLFVKAHLTKSCMLLFFNQPPFTFLFVRVDIDLFVIINILFVWFVCLFGRMQHSVNVSQARISYNHNWKNKTKHCLLRNLIVSCLFVLEDVL